jgi:hypothetical protein
MAQNSLQTHMRLLSEPSSILFPFVKPIQVSVRNWMTKLSNIKLNAPPPQVSEI